MPTRRIRLTNIRNLPLDQDNKFPEERFFKL